MRDPHRGCFDPAGEDVCRAEWRLIGVDLDAELSGHCPLRVDVDREYAVTEMSGRGGKLLGGCRFADAALFLGDGGDHGIGGSAGQEYFLLGRKSVVFVASHITSWQYLL